MFLFHFDSSFLKYYAHNLSSSVQNKKKTLGVTCVTQKLQKDAKCRDHREWEKNTDIFIPFSFCVVYGMLYSSYYFLENEDIRRVLKIYFERIKKLKDYPKDDRLQRFTEKNEKDYMQQAYLIMDF